MPPANANATTTSDADKRIESIRLATGASVSLGGKIVGRFIQVVGQIVFARYLGMEDFGRFSLGLTILRILAIVTPLGLHRAAVVFGARYWKVDDARFRGVVFATLALALASGVSFAIALAAGAGWLSTAVFHESISSQTLRAFAFAVPLVALLRVSADLTRLSQRMELGTIAEDIVQPVVALAVFLAAYALTDGLTAAVAATTIGYAAACGFAAVAMLLLFPMLGSSTAPTRWQTADLVAFSTPTALAIFSGAFTSMIDRLVVGSYCPPDQMAVYQAASQVSVAFTIIIGAFTTIFAPMAAHCVATDDRAQLRRLLRNSTRWGLYLALPLYIVVVTVPGTILAMTFGSSYRYGELVLVVLATAQLINVASGNVGILLVIAGQQKTWLALTLLATVINCTVSVVFVPRYGLVGGALGNILSASVIFGGGMLFVWRRLGIWGHNHRTTRLAVAAAFAFVAGRLALALVGSAESVVVLGVVSVACGSVFVAAAWLLGLDEDDRALARDAVRRLTGPARA